MSTVTAAVGVHEVPAATIALSAIDKPDYADEFTLHNSGISAVRAEVWARSMFGDVPNAAERFIFQTLLRLRLARNASPETVAGFTITGQTDEWTRLEAHSPLLTCNLVIQARGDRASLATVMDYSRPRGRITWQLVSIAHRRLAPGILREAAAEVSQP